MKTLSDILFDKLAYDCETGVFIWKRSSGRCAKGSVAGATDKRGYIFIKIDGRNYSAHRLAWYFVHGQWPESEIDHENRNPSDNRISNLRQCTRSENNANTGIRRSNTSGAKGVSFDRERCKWRATIQIDNRHKFLGRFETREEAASAYRQAAKRIFGRFAGGLR